MSNEDLILLSASPDAGAGMVEGIGVQGEEDGGSDAWAKHSQLESAFAHLIPSIFSHDSAGGERGVKPDQHSGTSITRRRLCNRRHPYTDGQYID